MLPPAPAGAGGTHWVEGAATIRLCAMGCRIVNPNIDDNIDDNSVSNIINPSNNDNNVVINIDNNDIVIKIIDPSIVTNNSETTLTL